MVVLEFQFLMSVARNCGVNACQKASICGVSACQTTWRVKIRIVDCHIVVVLVVVAMDHLFL